MFLLDPKEGSLIHSLIHLKIVPLHACHVPGAKGNSHVKAALMDTGVAGVTYFLLFTQVSEAAMARVPEPTSEMSYYCRSVGRLRPAMGADPELLFQEWSVICAWRPDLSPKLPLSVASTAPS